MFDGKKMLHRLLDKYENSILSKQGSDRNLKIRFKPATEYKEYYENFRAAQNLNEDVQDYEKQGFVTVQWQEDDIDEVVLNLEAVNKIYLFLKRSSKMDFETELLKLVSNYKDSGFNMYLEDVENRIINHQSYKSLVFEDLTKQKQLLDSLRELFMLKNEVLERVFSVRVLNDSKAFERIKSKVLMILRKYYASEEIEDDELLASYNVIKNPTQLIVKGKGTLYIGKSVIHLEDFVDGFVISSGQIDLIHRMDIPEKTLVTVENLTSFYECCDDNVMFLYLGGYHNSIRREFLITLLNMNPELAFKHFGDIDAGGFLIMNHLKEKTGISFVPVCMDIETLVRYCDKTHPLTIEDAKRLERLKDDECFKGVVEYMLANNVKLEQENVQLSL